MIKRLEEIKFKLSIPYLSIYDGKLVEFIECADAKWLIEKLEKAIEMAKFYEKYKDDGLRACDFLKELE